MVGTEGVSVGGTGSKGAAVSVAVSVNMGGIEVGGAKVGDVIGVACFSSATIVSTMAVCAAFGSTVGTAGAVPMQARVAAQTAMKDRMREGFFIVKIL